MRKLIVLGLVAGLMFNVLAPVEAAKKKKKPVAAEQKFFLHDTSCDAENTMSLLDGADQSCWYVDSGVAYTAFEGAGLLTAEDLGQSWLASDGVPLTLDATKPITGEISTSSGACAIDGGCAPVGVGAGQATLDVWVFGTIDGEEKELGTFSEDYVIAPGQTHTSKLSLELDPALDKAVITDLRVLTFLHGAQLGHGVIELENPASFVTMPAWVVK